MATIGELMIRAGIDIADVVTGAAGIAKEMEGISNTVDRQLGSLDKLSARWQEVGVSLTTYVSLPLAAVSAAFIKAAVDFDDASDRIRARTGATGEALAGMSDSFKNVFSSIPTSASDASEAISGLVQRLGIAGKPLEDLATQELNLARITETSIGPLIASTTRLFGDWSVSTEKQSGALDYLYKVTQTSGIGIGKLTDLIVQFGAPMRALGLDMEHAAVLLGKWEKEGVNITTVLSGMRMELARMAKAGIDTSSGFQAIIDSIKNAKSETEALTMSVKIFGQRAAVDMFRAIKEGRFDVDAWVNSLKASTETINGVAEATLSFSDKLVLLKNKIETALEPIGTVLTGIFEHAMDGSGPILDFIQSISDGFAKLSPTTQEWIIGLAAAAAAIGPIAIGAAAVVTGFTAVTAALAPVVAGIAGFLVSMSGISAAAIEADAALGATAIGIGAVATALAVGAAAFAGWQIGGIVSGIIDLGSNLITLKEQFFGATDVMSIFATKEEECGLSGTIMGNSLAYTAQLLKDGAKAANDWHWSDYINPAATFTKVLNDLNKEIAEYIAKSTIAWKDAPNGINAVTDQMRKQADAVMKTDAANKALGESNDRASERARQLGVDIGALTQEHEKAAKATKVHQQSLTEWYISANKFLDTLIGPKNLESEIAQYWDKMEQAFAPTAWLAKVKAKLDVAIASIYQGTIPANTPAIAAALKAMFEEATQSVMPTIAAANKLLSGFGVISQSEAAQARAAIEKERRAIEDIYSSSENRLLDFAIVNAAQMAAVNIKAGEEQIALARKTGQDVTDAQIEALRAQKAAFTNAHMDIEQAYKTLNVTATRHYDEEYEAAKTAYGKIVASKLSSNQDILKADTDLYAAALAKQEAHGDRATETQKRQLAKLADESQHGIDTLAKQWDLFANHIGDAVGKGLDGLATDLLTGKKIGNIKDIFSKIWQDIAQSFVKDMIQPITTEIGKFITGALKSLIGGDGFGGIVDAAKKAGKAITDVFGGGAAVASTAANAGGAASSAGGAASAASGAAGIMGIANVVTGAISAISGIIGNFQFAHMNTALGRIEVNTREMSTVMWQTGGESIQGILKTIQNLTMQVLDRLIDLRIALFDPVAKDLEDIYKLLQSGVAIGTGTTAAIEGTTGAVEAAGEAAAVAAQTASQTAGEHLVALEKQLQDLNVEIAQTKTVLSADNKALADQLKKNGDKNDPLYLALKAKVDADNALIQKDTATATAVTTAIKSQQTAIANAEKGIAAAVAAAAGGVVGSVDNNTNSAITANNNLAGTITQANGEVINALGQTGSEVVQNAANNTGAILQQLAALGSDMVAVGTVNGNAYSDLKSKLDGVAQSVDKAMLPSNATSKMLNDAIFGVQKSTAETVAQMMGLEGVNDWIPRSNNDPAVTYDRDRQGGYQIPTYAQPLAPTVIPLANAPGGYHIPGYTDYSNGIPNFSLTPPTVPASPYPGSYTNQPGGGGMVMTKNSYAPPATLGNVTVNLSGPVTNYEYANQLGKNIAEQVVIATR